VKPKLDQFLLANYSDFDDYKKYLIGYSETEDNIYGENYQDRFQNFAFSYKIKIVSIEPVELCLTERLKDGKWQTPSFPFLLANMGGKETREELKNFIFYNNTKLIITSIHKQLLDKIDELMRYFLVSTNFGNRQSKGFGCFYLEDAGNDDFYKDLCELNDGNVYQKTATTLPKTNNINYFENLFKTVAKDYQLLKSGIRDRESCLKQYFDEQGILWEKLAIRLHLNSEVINDEYGFIRIILGLADHHEYPLEKFIVTIEDANKEIIRFKSPLTIKFFNSNVYMIPEVIPDDIFDRTFLFSFVSDEEEFLDPLELTTPSKPSDDFFIKFLDQYLPILNYKKINPKS